jgi:IS5 family transposase
MQPAKSVDNQNRLFESRLENMINMDHALVRLSEKINWKSLEQKLGEVYIPDKGRPALPTRLMAGLHYLKGMFALSDERAVEGFLENPYWQYFCGMEFFARCLPLDSSSMTRWRKRAGSRGFEGLLSETLQAAERTGQLKESDFKRVNVDTTVQEKNITYPTDAKLLCKGIELIVRHCKRNGVELRQSYARVAPKALRDSARYAHSRKFGMAQKCVRRLRTCLGRVIRDVGRKISDIPEDFSKAVEMAARVYNQRKKDTNKLYSYFAPEASCIAKGKEHKKYEFGCKASIVSTSAGNWIIGAKAFHGNPFDGHTLASSLAQVEELSGHYPREAYCDKGYRGVKSEDGVRCEILIPGLRGKRTKTIKRYLKRRNAIEPIIGHIKSDHGMDRNWLKGEEGDRINILMASCGFNMKKLLRAFLSLLSGALYWLRFRGKLTQGIFLYNKNLYS